MSESLIHTIYLAIAFLVLFGSAEVLYRYLKVKAEITRKYVHIFTGLITLLFPPLIGDHWLVLALCASFLLILLTSMPLKLLPSINAVERTTRGSLIYPIIVYGCFILYQHFNAFELYYVPILLLALCDPIAEFVGKNWPMGRYTFLGHTKTLSGSAGFFVGACVTAGVVLQYMHDLPLSSLLMIAAPVALATTIAEGLAHKGYDNFTIPGTAAAVLLLFKEYTELI